MNDIRKLYDQYGKMVYNLALQYLHNVEDAEEVTQDVFVSAHQKISDFRGEAELKTWFYRLAINKSLDYLKAQKTKKRWSFFSNNKVDESQLYNASDFNHPGLNIESAEEIKQILVQINKLPEKQKTVLILLKIDGLSMNEVAEIMELSYKAVESALQRAKNNLKILLQKAKDNDK